MNNPRVEAIKFRADLAAGVSVTLKERLKGNCTIEELRTRFYAGQEGTLHIRPCLWQTGRGVLVDLVTYPSGTLKYLAGEDDREVYKVTMDALLDDEVWLICENVGDYTYTVNCDVIIDYFAGTNRVVGGVS